MKCSNCQTVNPEGAKFCINCGNTLALTCSNCGTPLMAGAKFCQNCGHPAGTPIALVATPAPPSTAPPVMPTPTSAPEPAVGTLQQFIPKEFLSKLEAARANRSMEGERRIVTVLFWVLGLRAFMKRAIG